MSLSIEPEDVVTYYNPCPDGKCNQDEINNFCSQNGTEDGKPIDLFTTEAIKNPFLKSRTPNVDESIGHCYNDDGLRKWVNENKKDPITNLPAVIREEDGMDNSHQVQNLVKATNETDEAVYTITVTFTSNPLPNRAIVHAVLEGENQSLRREVLYDGACNFSDKKWEFAVRLPPFAVALCVTFLQKVDGGWSEHGRVRFLHRDSFKKTIQLCDADATACGLVVIDKTLPMSRYVPLRRLVGDLVNSDPSVLRDVFARRDALTPQDPVRIVDDPWFFARSLQERNMLEAYVQETMNWFLKGGSVEALSPSEPILHKAHMPMYNNNVLGMPGWAFLLNRVEGSDSESTYAEAFHIAYVTSYGGSYARTRDGFKSTASLRDLDKVKVREVMMRGLQLFAASLKYRSDTRDVGDGNLKTVESFCHTARQDGVGDCEDHAYQLVVAATKFAELELSPDSELRAIQEYAKKFHFGLVLGTVTSTNTQAHAFNAAIDKLYFQNPSETTNPKEKIIIMDGTNPLGERGALSEEYDSSSKGFKPPRWYKHLVCFMSPTAPAHEYFFETKEKTYGVLLKSVQEGDFTLEPVTNFVSPHTFDFERIKTIINELLQVNREATSGIHEEADKSQTPIGPESVFLNFQGPPTARFSHIGLHPEAPLRPHNGSFASIGARPIFLV
jgi:hypothetical protein